MSLFLDTDICLAHMKGNTQVHGRFVQYGGRLHISTVTLGELYAWALRVKASPMRMQSLLELVKEVRVLALDESTAGKFGELRASQLDRGLGRPNFDLLNAAVALDHNLTLVTHNIQDYADVPGLTVVDWLAP